MVEEEKEGKEEREREDVARREEMIVSVEEKRSVCLSEGDWIEEDRMERIE